MANSADNQTSILTDLGEKILAVGDYVTDSNGNTFKVATVSGATFSVGDAVALPVDHYDEYLFIGGTFEKIGDSKVDLSGYATTESVTAAVNAATEAASADATSKAGKALEDAKAYSDGLAKNYDVAGAANTALESAKAYTDEQVATKVDQAAVDSSIAAKVGEIAEGTTVKQYIDTAVGSGGTASAEAIATAKKEAIAASNAYTDNALTLVEF